MKQLLTVLAVAFTFAATAQTSGYSKRDEKFAKKAAMGGLLEVKLGEMAQSRATEPKVKETARHMVEDHRLVNEELKDMATRKNLTLPSTLDNKTQKKYDYLSKFSGKKFDRKYSRCMVKDHKKDICLFKKEAKRGDNPELKAWASAKLPKLESHLKMWKDACKEARK
jgi:putative membrane protein